jgi:hypothetical protein
VESRIAAYSQAHHVGVVDVIVSIQQSEFGIHVTPEQQPDMLAIPGFYQKGRTISESPSMIKKERKWSRGVVEGKDFPD